MNNEACATESLTALEAAFADANTLISPSIYETGRVCALAPTLRGHRARLDYLADTQNADGSWGLGNARLVPSLSALDALLLAQAAEDGPRDEQLTAVTRRAVGVLEDLIAEADSNPPDSVAIELIVPHLLDCIRISLRRAGIACPGLRDPLSVSRPVLIAVTEAFKGGRMPSEKLLHSWETFGPAGRGVVRTTGGAVACSPAATALWAKDLLDVPAATAGYLEEVNDLYGGPVPVAWPMPHFERSWIVCRLIANEGATAA